VALQAKETKKPPKNKKNNQPHPPWTGNAAEVVNRKGRSGQMSWEKTCSGPRLGKGKTQTCYTWRRSGGCYRWFFMLGAVIVTNIDKRRLKKQWRLERCAGQDKGKSCFSFCLGEYPWQVLGLDDIR